MFVGNFLLRGAGVDFLFDIEEVVSLPLSAIAALAKFERPTESCVLLLTVSDGLLTGAAALLEMSSFHHLSAVGESNWFRELYVALDVGGGGGGSAFDLPYCESDVPLRFLKILSQPLALLKYRLRGIIEGENP